MLPLRLYQIFIPFLFAFAPFTEMEQNSFSNLSITHSPHRCSSHFHQNQTDYVFLIEEEQSNGDIILYARNTVYSPVTIDVFFDELENMEVDQPLPYSTVLEPMAERTKLLRISQAKRLTSRNLFYRYAYQYYLGDVNNARHDDDFIYSLPFEKGSSYMLGQGYHGKFSHNNLFGLDFNMEEGSAVHAARGGVVIKIKVDSNQGCASSHCQGKANYIVILHDDGTMGRYVHLAHNGSVVELGQQVVQGQHIGYSGNTGWSSGPHLHFEVDIPTKNRAHSVPTQFQSKEGILKNLKEGQFYMAH